MMQERLIEVFETEGGIRSTEEIYVHNTLLKATRNIFRFYSRKVTESFFKWRFTLENHKNIKIQKEMERSLKQTKKAVDDGKQSLFNLTREFESFQIKASETNKGFKNKLVETKYSYGFKTLK